MMVSCSLHCITFSPYIFCTFQKILFLLKCITCIWKCFLQAFSVKYPSDTFSSGKTNLWYKGGCYQRQIRKQPQTTFCPLVIFYCCFVETPKFPASLQGQLLGARMPDPTSQDILHVHRPPMPYPALPQTLPSQWWLLLWLCYRLFQLYPSQLVCSTPATQKHSGWCLSPDKAALGTVWKQWTCEWCFHFLMTEEDISGCFWEESEPWIWMSASIINEAIMGSAGFLKTCCWWRCWWEAWHSEGQAVQPYGMCVGSPWHLAGVASLTYGSWGQHEE